MARLREKGKVYRRFVGGHLIERDHLQDQGVEVRIVLKIDIKETELKSVDWIKLAQDRDKWQSVVNMVMNFMSHKMRTIC